MFVPFKGDGHLPVSELCEAQLQSADKYNLVMING